MYNYTIIKNSFDLIIVTAIPGTTDRGTRDIILDAILHCRNENVPTFRPRNGVPGTRNARSLRSPVTKDLTTNHSAMHHSDHPRKTKHSKLVPASLFCYQNI
jgi:hypothetical protein